MIATLDANLNPDAEKNVSLAEEAVAYAAELVLLVEDVTLDTLWLGLRVRGTGADGRCGLGPRTVPPERGPASTPPATHRLA